MQYSKLIVAVLGALGVQLAGAVPTAEEAAQLGKTLTPMGAIKAGNKDGTIPEWTGGICTPPADYKPVNGREKGGGPWVDPFAADKPLFKITAANMEQYADKLDEGQKEMFRRFPKTFYMNVYPTRRSACFPNYVYENTIKRVMNPKIVGGNVPSVTGAHAQVPFPIPKSGPEALWNRLVSYDDVFNVVHYLAFYVDASGQRSMVDSDIQYTYKPYWDNSITSIPENKPVNLIASNKQYPASMVGNQNLLYTYLRADQRGDPVWSYVPGQRRVRLAPEFAYDGVAPSAGGTMLYDEGGGFMGKMDKFDFKLTGRKEMFVSYNGNEAKLNRPEVATPNHADPAAIRWELHRVWEVDGTLKQGERHVQKRKVIYLDEDSWNITSYIGFDQAGKTHHYFHYHYAQFYERPAILRHGYDSYDFAKGAYTHWMNSGSSNGVTSTGSRKLKSIPLQTFTPEGMAGGGLR